MRYLMLNLSSFESVGPLDVKPEHQLSSPAAPIPLKESITRHLGSY